MMWPGKVVFFLWDNDCILESGLSVNSNYLSGVAELNLSQALRNKVHVGSDLCILCLSFQSLFFQIVCKKGHFDDEDKQSVCLELIHQTHIQKFRYIYFLHFSKDQATYLPTSFQKS